MTSEHDQCTGTGWEHFLHLHTPGWVSGVPHFLQIWAVPKICSYQVIVTNILNTFPKSSFLLRLQQALVVGECTLIREWAVIFTFARCDVIVRCCCCVKYRGVWLFVWPNIQTCVLKAQTLENKMVAVLISPVTPKLRQRLISNRFYKCPITYAKICANAV